MQSLILIIVVNLCCSCFGFVNVDHVSSRNYTCTCTLSVLRVFGCNPAYSVIGLVAFCTFSILCQEIVFVLLLG